MPNCTLIPGDSLNMLPALPANSVDAVITDPPYGLTDLPSRKVTAALTNWVTGDRSWVPENGKGFMGRDWDRFVPPPALWDEVFRVLKPGGLALVFAGARTFDLMGMSCRLAGFDVRDSVAWINSQSMPKTSDLGKVTGEPVWAGWSTGLKSCNEPFLVLRKPFQGAMRDHIAVHGTGAYHIDATRVQAADPDQVEEQVGRWTPNVTFSHHPDCRPAGTITVTTSSHHPSRRGSGGIGSSGHHGQSNLVERRPTTEQVEASQCHPDCPVRALDEQSGTLTSGANPTRRNGAVFPSLYGTFAGDGTSKFNRGTDTGGASRFFPAFFYCAKATSAERPTSGEGDPFVAVKPLNLIRWMVRLVAAPGSVILDPFAGSGTTGEACLLEGFDSILIEREPQHLPLIQQRIDRASRPHAA